MKPTHSENIDESLCVFLREEKNVCDNIILHNVNM